MEDLLKAREQVQLRDLSQLLDTVQDIAVVMAKLEKRPTKTEILIETFEPEGALLPLPPIVAQFLDVPTAPLVGGLYEMPAPKMPMGVPLPRQSNIEQAEAIRPR